MYMGYSLWYIPVGYFSLYIPLWYIPLWYIPLWYISLGNSHRCIPLWYIGVFLSLFGIIHYGIFLLVFLFVYSSWVYSSDSLRYIPLGYTPLGIHFGKFLLGVVLWFLSSSKVRAIAMSDPTWQTKPNNPCLCIGWSQSRWTQSPQTKASHALNCTCASSTHETRARKAR